MKSLKINLNLLLIVAFWWLSFGLLEAQNEHRGKIKATSLRQEYLPKITWIYPSSPSVDRNQRAELIFCVKSPLNLAIQSLTLVKDKKEIPLKLSQLKKGGKCGNGGSQYNYIIEFVVDDIDRELEFSVKATNEAGTSKSATRKVTAKNVDIRKLVKKLKPDFNRKKYYALIFAVNDYKNQKKLKRPIEDAQRLSRVLKEYYGFEVETYPNPTRGEVIDALNRVKKKLDPKNYKHNNLLIFYSGHGTVVDKNGYWMLKDAGDKPSSWLSNAEVLSLINTLAFNCRDILMVIDACYSGAIFTPNSEIKSGSLPIQVLNKAESYQAITSNFLRFIREDSPFVDCLAGALRNNELPFVTSSRIFNSLKSCFLSISPENIPQFRKLNVKANINIGDFIFYQKSKAVEMQRK